MSMRNRMFAFLAASATLLSSCAEKSEVGIYELEAGPKGTEHYNAVDSREEMFDLLEDGAPHTFVDVDACQIISSNNKGVIDIKDCLDLKDSEVARFQKVNEYHKKLSP